MSDTGPASLSIQESSDLDGFIRLKLGGELDLATVVTLEHRLNELARARSSVLLDLSELQFLDSTGLRLIITAVTDARQNGWSLKLARELSPPVRRVLELIQIDGLLWPGES